MFQLILLLYLSFYEINNKPEIETKWDWREIEINLQSQPQAYNCSCEMITVTISLQVLISVYIGICTISTHYLHILRYEKILNCKLFP